MRRFVSFVAAGTLALFATAASAQSGDGCVLNGTSTIGDGGIPASATPIDQATLPFEFTGDLGPCATGAGEGGQTCAIGTVTGSCQGNTHEAQYVVCPDECVIGGGVASCLDVPNNAPIASGTLSGVCVGSVCVGGDAEAPGGAYALVFDADTVVNALEQCADSENGAITEASFTGAIVAGSPQ